MRTTSHEIGLLLGAALWVGIVAGLAMATQSLPLFAPVPGWMLLGSVVVAGVGMGSLFKNLTQVLLAVILTVIVSVMVTTLALVYPEMGPEALLGVEAALAGAFRKALINGFFLVLPLTLIGALVGRFFSRHG
ncbi:MAG: hypothetical protein NZ610_06855 [Candidatus Bipolaricaulota bacterium]|nr:hypothetical protein [Candidatus Bipolaricaulota bacterium]MCS7275098.1 hypothetical protein [Candidatus Bipolaricaulota bacterium]MDW8110426.1 hypothetical protein [Candidatus Bipolaricaulota bacterium]MDW8329722.1 hypothetical protein [Candidatus Bipolaricaulota bacterium]